MRTVIGATLLDLGLLAMLCSFFLFIGLGLTGGLIAAVAAPMLIIGFLLDHTWARMAPRRSRSEWRWVAVGSTPS